MQTTLKLLTTLLLVILMVSPFIATRSYATSVSSTIPQKSFIQQSENSTSGNQTSTNLEEDLNEDLNNLSQEVNVTISNLPPGWKISAIVHTIIELHKEEVENITLVRKLFLNETKNLRLQLINETRTTIGLQIQNMTREMQRLREEYLAGNITKEEYLMEMLRLRLRLREEICKLKTLREEMQNLSKRISKENKELAKNLVQINKEFAELMKKVHDEVKQFTNATKQMEKYVHREENKMKGIGNPMQRGAGNQTEGNETQGWRWGKP